MAAGKAGKDLCDDKVEMSQLTQGLDKGGGYAISIQKKEWEKALKTIDINGWR